MQGLGFSLGRCQGPCRDRFEKLPSFGWLPGIAASTHVGCGFRVSRKGQHARDDLVWEVPFILPSLFASSCDKDFILSSWNIRTAALMP